MDLKGKNLTGVLIGINLVLIVLVVNGQVNWGRNQGFNFNGMLGFSGSDSNTEVSAGNSNLKVGYFDLDMVSEKLSLVQDFEEKLTEEFKSAELKLKNKQAEIERWQAAWMKRGQLLPAEEKQYMSEAREKEMAYQTLENRLRDKLVALEESQVKKVETEIRTTVKNLAKKQNFDFIMSYQFGGELYYAKPVYDISEELVLLMNENYRSTH